MGIELQSILLAFTLILSLIALAKVEKAHHKRNLSRVFTDDYKSLKQSFPNPLKTINANGYLITKSILSYRFPKGLKVDVYNNMLILSSTDLALLLEYDKYVFKYAKLSFIYYLEIENLDVGEKKYKGWAPAEFGNTTTLRIHLSKKQFYFIDSLIKKTRNIEKTDFDITKSLLL